MMFPEFLIDLDFSRRLCETLLHSLWQVPLVALIAWLVDHSWPRRAVETSYAIYVTALAAGLMLLPATFMVLGSAPQVGTAEIEQSAFATPMRIVPSRNLRSGSVETPDSVMANAEYRADSIVKPAPIGATLWPRASSWITLLYSLGVLGMTARLAVGQWRVRRLVAESVPITGGVLAEELRTLARDGSSRIIPALARSERIAVPRIVGFLKPTILLPTALMTGMSAEDVKMILAHELAHLRRHDVWINLAQRLAEAVLFFNPMLWILSRRITTLREYCCDELACGVLVQSRQTSRVRYAAALLRVAELSLRETARGGRRASRPALDLTTLAADGRSPSELRRRVARLFGEPVREPIRMSRGGLLAIGGIAAALLVGPLVWPSTAQSDPPSDGLKSPVDDPENATASENKKKPLGEREANDTDKVSEDSYTFPITITGTAMDQQMNPIAGAEIYLVSRNPGYKKLAKTTSADNGRYAFESVALPIERADKVAGEDHGSFEIFAVAEGYALTWRTHKTVFPNEAKKAEPNWEDKMMMDLPTYYGREEPINLNLTFTTPVTLRGRVVNSDGEPIPNTKLRIRGCGLEWWDADYNTMSGVRELSSLNNSRIMPPEINVRKTDADGRFEFTGLPSDFRWRIDVSPPDHSSRIIWAVTRDVPKTDARGNRVYSGDFEVVFSDQREMTFRVVYDDTGEPAPKVGVGGRVTEAGFWETTDENGIARAKLPDGRFTISMSPQYQTPYLNTEVGIVVSEETAEKTTTLRIKRAVVVEITVVDDKSGKSLPGVDVWVEEPVPGSAEPYRHVHGYRSWEVETRISHYERPRTNEEGKMRVLFKPGVHRIGVGLEAYPKGYAPASRETKEIVCRAGEVVKVTFRLQRTDDDYQ